MSDSDLRNKLIKELNNNGFIRSRLGNGSHEVYIHPFKKPKTNSRPFITVPRKVKFGLYKATLKIIKSFK